MGASIDYTDAAGDEADRLDRLARCQTTVEIADYWGDLRLWLVDRGMNSRSASSVASFLRAAAGGLDPRTDMPAVRARFADKLEAQATSAAAAPMRWRIRKWLEYVDAGGDRADRV